MCARAQAAAIFECESVDVGSCVCVVWVLPMYAQQRHAHWNYFLQPSSLSCFLTCLVRDSCNRQQLQPITRTAKYVWRCSNDARAYAIEYVHVPADLTADSRTSACTQTHLCATHLSTAIPAHTLKSSGLVFLFVIFTYLRSNQRSGHLRGGDTQPQPPPSSLPSSSQNDWTSGLYPGSSDGHTDMDQGSWRINVMPNDMQQ
jgi:hypothetical protein